MNQCFKLSAKLFELYYYGKCLIYNILWTALFVLSGCRTENSSGGYPVEEDLTRWRMVPASTLPLLRSSMQEKEVDLVLKRR